MARRNRHNQRLVHAMDLLLRPAVGYVKIVIHKGLRQQTMIKDGCRIGQPSCPERSKRSLSLSTMLAFIACPPDRAQLSQRSSARYPTMRVDAECRRHDSPAKSIQGRHTPIYN